MEKKKKCIHTYTCVCVCVCVYVRERERGSKKSALCHQLFSLSVNSSQSAYPCSHCVVSSHSGLALLQLVLASKFHGHPQSSQSQAICRNLICCICCCRNEFHSSLFTKSLVFHFGFCPFAGHPQTSVPHPDKSGED